MYCKILFTDLDGTLLTSQKQVSPAMRGLLERMLRAGGRLVFTSGRALPSILQVAQKSGLLFPDTVIIAANGNEIYDCASQTFWLRKSVPTDVAADILHLARDLGIYIQSYDDTSVVSSSRGPELARYLKNTGMEAVITQDILGTIGRPPSKLIAISLTDHEKLELLRSRILARYRDTVAAIFSCREYLEIFDKTAGKGNALRFVCSRLGIAPSECAASGDAENDISMLDAAGTAIAMANADPAVKEHACFVTEKDNDHDGLGEAIEKYFRL
ncbi:MAG: Cof-type HAD-IIB family hydrolase [Eubacteriales bacterium]|nr:Cof-type HAD-IIB family hydrolase [Eubacteriales bacterium]